VRAFRADPSHVPTLYAYAMSHWMEREPVSQSVLDVLIRAHLLAPQVSEIGFATADELIRHGRFEEAVTVLGPIASAPHGGEAAELAQQMREAARRGEIYTPTEAEGAEAN
jgi:thioredoxin-like negative regulator of GroEL